MALQIWLPLTGDTHNQGLDPMTFNRNTSTTWVSSSGMVGYCYSLSGFNGSGIYSASNLSEFRPKYIDNHSFSICAFFNTTETGYTTPLLSITYGIRCFVGNATTVILYTSAYGNSVSQGCNANMTTNDGKWHHYATTYSAEENKMAIYVDGVLRNRVDYIIGSGQTYRNVWTNNFYIGRDPNNSTANAGYFFQGSVNDVRFYDHCLSDKEVKEISKGLIMHYKLDDAYIENTVNALETKSNNFVGIWSSYGFGSRGTITSANIEPAIDGQVALITNNSSATTDTASEMATGFNITGLQSGEKITCSAYVKGNGPTVGKRVRLHIYYNSACGATSTGSEFILTNEWKRDSFTYTWNKPVSANSPNFYVVGYDKAGESFYVSNCQVEKKDHATPYTYIEREQSMTYDSSGYNKYGEIVGNLSVMNSAPKHENSLYIEDGRYNYVRTRMMLPLYEATMSIWVKTTSTGYTNYHIPMACGTYYEISIASSGVLRQGFTVNGTRKVIDTTSKNVMDGQWHMLTATFDGSAIRRYVDGEQVGSAQSAPGVLTSGERNLFIGTFDENHTYGCNKCNLSDARMYGKALSADDIKELYNLGASIDNKGNIFAFEIKED